MPFLRGTVAAARAGRQGQRQQPVLHHVRAERSRSNGNYTVSGRVISGMDGVDKIAAGEPPAEPTKIVRAYLGGQVR